MPPFGEIPAEVAGILWVRLGASEADDIEADTRARGHESASFELGHQFDVFRFVLGAGQVTQGLRDRREQGRHPARARDRCASAT